MRALTVRLPDANGSAERFTRAHCSIEWYHLSHILQLEVRMLNVSAEDIGAVLGIRRKPKGIEDLMATIERGLPRAALDHALAFLGTLPGIRRRELIGEVVGFATYKRRRTLLAAESEKVARIARVIAFAKHVWDDDDAAREFLTTPHPMLSGQRPIDLAFSELGAIRVEHVLSGILHGAAA